MRSDAGKQALKTTRKLERLALELEEMAANGGPAWKFGLRFSQFGDAEDRYQGDAAMKPYSDRVMTAFDVFWARPENKDAP